ncbi:MAG: glucosaminidase domain-containing protein [Alphaproteobacteria bacterium]|nr:glucosaminidase domain-containing protein [Alphaproteobacteria bacterium]
MLTKAINIKDKYFINILYLFVISLLFLLGFIGPGFWKMNSPNFKFVVFQKDLNKDTIIVNKEVKFNFNNKYLSSDQINKKSKVIKWSNQVLRSIENQLPVPRMYFSSIPKNINEYKIFEKKKVFLSILLPIALRGNELALEERKRLKVAFLTNNIYKIEYFAKKYKVKNFTKINFGSLNSLQLRNIKKELLIKVNRVPVSMIIAQAIIESGWGSSRFAQEGNALFGEWTWKSNDGIKPNGNLDANFAVKSFKNISESLNSYILNLNRHPAYTEMRNYRSMMFKAGKDITGYDTAAYLENYAEIGLAYVEKVNDMIKSNKLYKFENSVLEKR